VNMVLELDTLVVPRAIDEWVWNFGGLIGDKRKPKCLWIEPWLLQ
jgi:hypothetical protein